VGDAITTFSCNPPLNYPIPAHFRSCDHEVRPWSNVFDLPICSCVWPTLVILAGQAMTAKSYCPAPRRQVICKGQTVLDVEQPKVLHPSFSPCSMPARFTLLHYVTEVPQAELHTCSQGLAALLSCQASRSQYGRSSPSSSRSHRRSTWSPKRSWSGNKD
jgi:hypothetical protein